MRINLARRPPGELGDGANPHAGHNPRAGKYDRNRTTSVVDSIGEKNIFSGLPDAKLTPEQEAECVRVRDLEKLILHNLREAVLYAGRCARGLIEPGELLSVCYAALSKSAPRFRSGGISFFAYSKADLRGEIFRYWKSLNPVRNSYAHESEETPQLIVAEKPSCNTYDNSDETGYMVEDAAPIEPEHADFAFDVVELRERWALVQPLLAKHLNERERTILTWVYDSGFSFEQIAGLMVPRVCREAIRMTHERALRKIRNALLRSKRLYSTT